MWIETENSNEEKPLEIDKTSSKKFVYVRKDFTEVPMTDQDGNQIGTKWQYKEKKIPKADWEVYEQIMSNESVLTDTQLAICELYEMIQNNQ